MGQVVSLLKIASVSAMLLSDTAAMAEPTTLFVGPMGSGKTSTIKNLCGADLNTGNGMFSVTPEMQAVRCNGQTRLDTAGLLHLTEGDSDNGAYRGLLTLLESLEGKEVGRIYVVISSSQAKNHGTKPDILIHSHGLHPICRRCARPGEAIAGSHQSSDPMDHCRELLQQHLSLSPRRSE